MPYSLSAPPEAVKGLPKHAVEIFVSAYNAAFKQYEGDEAKSAATAWTAVKTKFEKSGDKWVAKESKEASMTIADIIQEAAKRGLTIDPRVKTLVYDEKATPEALAEAMVWLKLQEAQKTEDGEDYPAAAFAYVPDPEKPSEWKLRLWEDSEKKVTRAQLGRAAAALSPGGFRGQKVSIPSADLPTVKRKIRGEYRKLDVADEEIPKWVMEAEMRELLSEYLSLVEAKIGTKGNAQVVVIKPGMNSSGQRFYPPETLARDFKVFEGVKMYADHPSEADEKNRPERSVKDWVATLKNVHIGNDGAVLGEAVVVEPWMQERLATLRDKGLLADMGISINAIGTATKSKVNGADTNVIEKIVRARSVDFVTEAGAGGGIELYEANREDDIDLVSLESLKERRPDLIKLVETAVKAAQIQEVKHMAEVEALAAEKTATIETLTKERDELKTKITEAEKAQKIAETKAAVETAVSKSDLPEPAKARIVVRFANATEVTGMEEAIKAERDYIAAITEAGKVKGMGGKVEDPKAGRDALKESMRKLRPDFTDAQIETAISGR